MAKQWWQGTFEQRMAHRAARRAENALHASAHASHSRACTRAARAGAKPPKFNGARQTSSPPTQKKPFDYEEYLTRLADRKAADPEYQKRLAERKAAKRKRFDKIREARELEWANKSMAEEVRLAEKVGLGRIRDIWNCIIHQDNEQKWRTSPTLSQQSRIKVTPRIRGCGRAAQRAGFAA